MRADVVVVGGGPSGAVCARELARFGYSVVLIERAKMPRSKVCGEYLNCGSVQHLQELGLLQSFTSQAHPLGGVRLNTAGRSLHLTFPTSAVSLSRGCLDFTLLEAARASGVHVMTGRISDLRFTDDEVSGVTFESDMVVRHIEARYIIGADGCGSVVARKLHLTKPLPQQVRYALGGHFAAQSADVVEMYIDKGTYLASNPQQGNCANVMLIAPKAALSSSAGRSNDWFRQTVQKMMPQAVFDIERRIGNPVAFGPLAHSVTATASRKVLLVGDAAGFISPFTGQGILLALSSARSAAATVHAILSHPSTEKRSLFEYDRLQRQDRWARSRLSSLLDILAYTPFLARRVMRRLETDDNMRNQLLNIFCGLTPPDFVYGMRLLFGMAVC